VSKNSSRLPSFGKIHTPVKWIVSLQNGDDKDHVTAWWREGEVPLLWALPREFRDVQLSLRIVFTALLSECIVIEKRILLRARSASPPLYRCPRYPPSRWGRVVTVPDTA